MPVHAFAEMTWEEVRDLPRERLVAVLPVGAVEAHGPHLPLSTDVVIAEAMAARGARALAARGCEALVLPTFPYTAAAFAGDFPGTISVAPETVSALLADVARALAGAGVRVLAFANAHLDPAHLASLHEAARRIEEAGMGPAAEGTALTVAFPDLTRKPWALRLTDEFKSGACHAGRFEGSVVMAARPELVREAIRRALPSNPASLSVAIREGKRGFAEAGGPRAYFGQPAEATTAEGRRTIEVLGGILADAVLERLDAEPASRPSS